MAGERFAISNASRKKAGWFSASLRGDVVVTIHCGSRGLGHQIGTGFLKEMTVAAKASGIEFADRELACAPIKSEVGQRYLGAMRAAINCALANPEILGHYARRVFGHFFPGHDLRLLFDVSHNTCNVEPHTVDGKAAACSFIAKGQPALSDPVTRRFPRRCVWSGSQCSSVAAWEPARTSW
jgi:tRNA-splicing ligase RtcB (3'-phosphate/5'-hydroxy nucleic acid ligase)